jgi:hypothetical protein
MGHRRSSVPRTSQLNGATIHQGSAFFLQRLSSMMRPWVLGVVAGAAAWALARYQARKIVPAKIAAEKLRQAWADYHTVA